MKPTSKVMSRMPLVCIAMLIVFLPICAFGQVGNKATILVSVENEGGEPMLSAKWNDCWNAGGGTGLCGRFSIRTVHYGHTRVRASMIGMEADSSMLTVRPGGSLDMVLEFRESTMKLKEVLVTGSAYSTDEEANAIGHP